MKPGDLIRLKGKSRHGKNRIQQHGTEWEIQEMGSNRGDPNKMLVSTGKDLRWVDLPHDADFEIVGHWPRDDSGDGPWKVESGTTGEVAEREHHVSKTLHTRSDSL